MNRAIWYGVFHNRKSVKWGYAYYRSHRQAKDTAKRLNDIYGKHKTFVVRRVNLVHKGDWIDVYNHHYERLKGKNK